jgi:anti-sigma factor RsiW
VTRDGGEEMTKKESRPVWTRVLALVAFAVLLQGCATGSAIPAQPQNPSTNAAATARG